MVEKFGDNMALTQQVDGQQADASDVNQIIDMLQGAVGSTETFILRTASGQDFVVILPEAGGAKSFVLQDSAGDEVFAVDSNGIITTTSNDRVLNNSAGRVLHEAGGLEFDASAITTGGLIRGASSGVMSILTIGSTDDVLTVAGGAPTWAAPAAGTVFVMKTSDESVTSSTTLQNDDHLTFTMAANKIYIVSGALLVDSGTTPDFKWTLNLAGSSTADLLSKAMLPSGASQVYKYSEGDTEGIQGAGAGTPQMSAEFTGIIKADGSGGALTLQWAQNTSNGTASKLLTGSWISYTLLN